MLNGKTAIVTGSTSGIGLGIAEALAQAGANIVLNGFGDTMEIEHIRCDLASAPACESSIRPPTWASQARSRT